MNLYSAWFLIDLAAKTLVTIVIIGLSTNVYPVHRCPPFAARLFKIPSMLPKLTAWLVALCCALSLQTNAQSLQLITGEVHLTPNLQSFSESPSTGWQGQHYGVLTFEQVPRQSTLQQLRAAGLTWGNYLPQRSYWVAFPTSLDVATLTRAGATTFTLLRPRQKVAPELWPSLSANAATAHTLEVQLHYHPGVGATTAQRWLAAEEGVTVLAHPQRLGYLSLSLPAHRLTELAALPWVTWIDGVQAPPQLDNARSKANHRSNGLGAQYAGARDLQGRGIIVGVFDTNLEQHIDYGTRATSHQALYSGRSPDHANHVTGTIAGAGWLDPNAIGMAPEATIHSWNCCSQVPQPIPVTMDEMADSLGITITSNSYGYGVICDTPRTYWTINQSIDQVAYDHPSMMHVFSAGNSQGTCPDPYFSVSWTHKNSLLVAATNAFGTVTNFSSFGPLFDGRIAPTISGVGSNVYSTVFDNGYGSKSGTSMSCPGVSGVMAQLYERYEQLHQTLPRADLMRAIVCNTATDQGNPGPDYVYGFGQINGLAAAALLENGTWRVDSIQQGEVHSIPILVGAGARQLRVTLAWNDLPGDPNAAFSLVNDLDITVVGNGMTVRPWVLDASNPSQNATRGIDRINNIVQITTDSLPAGPYQIIITGHTLPTGSQTYGLAYEVIKPHLALTSPFGGETITAGSTLPVHWDAMATGAGFELSYSVDGGTSWTTFATQPQHSRTTNWITPAQLYTDSLWVRILSGNLGDTVKAALTIAPTPDFDVLPFADNAQCDNSVLLRWDRIPGDHVYEVVRIDATGPQVVATTSDTAFAVRQLQPNVDYFFSVQVRDTLRQFVGMRAVAQRVRLLNGVDFSLSELTAPADGCGLGQEAITLTITNAGCQVLNSAMTIPLTVEVLGTGALMRDTIRLTAPLASGDALTTTLTALADLRVPSQIYTLEVRVDAPDDSLTAGNVLRKVVTHQPVITTLPYLQDFEADNGYWVSSEESGGNTWQWGEPFGNVITQAATGVNAWVTNLDGDYAAGESSYLLSPCFEVSSYGEDVYVRFAFQHDFGATIDRGEFQYSTDGGTNWTTAGALFRGDSGGWQTFAQTLAGTAGASVLRFRIRITSDQNDEVGEGIAIDDFWVTTATVSDKEVAFAESQLVLAPNPAQDWVRIGLLGVMGQSVQLSLHDALGRMVWQQQARAESPESSWVLPIEGFAKGLYFVRAQLKNGSNVTRKLILH